MKRNHWKDQFKLIESASNFHNEVREIFVSDPFWNRFKCYQEVSVKDLVPDYPTRQHHFDWFIVELNTIVELHGAQHYGIVNYGNIGYEDIRLQAIGIAQRDHAKKTAAIKHGYIYKVIKFNHAGKLNGERLKSLILE